MLSAHGLVKRYGAVTAVGGVDVGVDGGSIVGLVGNNGAGKTTTIKMLAGLLEPTAGTVRVQGEDPLRPAARRGIGFVPEDSPLYDDLPPRGHMAFFGALYGLSRKEALQRGEALFDRLRLDAPFRSRPAGTLSKGSQRKVALARALLHDPAVVILDEPTAGLDPATQGVLDEFLLELRQQGKAILLSAHDLAQVERLCDDVLVMHAGRVVRHGSLASLRGPARYRLRADVPFAGSVAAGSEHEAVLDGWERTAAAMDAVRAQGGRVLDLHAESPSLAEVLREATGA